MSSVVWPNGTTTQPYISDPFGWRTWTNPQRMHWGVDLTGFSSIHAVEAGTVVHVGYRTGWAGGYMVWIDHGSYLTRYLHMVNGSSPVSVGQAVTAGQRIGTMGDTDAPGQVHLHLEVAPGGGQQVDPIPFISNRINTSTTTKDPEELMLILVTTSASSDGAVKANQAYADNLVGPLVLLSSLEHGALDYWASRGVPYRRADWSGNDVRNVIKVRGVHPWDPTTGKSTYTSTNY